MRARNKSFKSVSETHPEFASRFHESSLVKPENVSRGSRSIGVYFCKLCEKTWSATVRSAVNGVGLCFDCAHKKFPKEQDSIVVTHPFIVDYWSHLNELSADFYSAGSNKKVLWICKNCGEVFKRVVQDFIRREHKNCADCVNRRHRVSKAETDLLNFLNSIENSFVQSVRNVIYPYEIDCFSSKLMVGFEFNGDYWHSDEMIEKTRGMRAQAYHDLKTNLCSAVGVKLFHVSENHWKDDRAAVETFIRKELGNML